MDVRAHENDDLPKMSGKEASTRQKRKAEQQPANIPWRNLRSSFRFLLQEGHDVDKCPLRSIRVILN